MNKIYKKRLILSFIIMSVLINLILINKIGGYIANTEINDRDFISALDMICDGIRELEGNEHDDIYGMAELASAIGQASSLYRLTSYYKENELLNKTLQILNNNISYNTNIKDVIEENDLTILIPVIRKVKENPRNSGATKELFYLVRKHTVIGSPLP